MNGNQLFTLKIQSFDNIDSKLPYLVLNQKVLVFETFLLFTQQNLKKTTFINPGKTIN